MIRSQQDIFLLLSELAEVEETLPYLNDLLKEFSFVHKHFPENESFYKAEKFVRKALSLFNSGRREIIDYLGHEQKSLKARKPIEVRPYNRKDLSNYSHQLPVNVNLVSARVRNIGQAIEEMEDKDGAKLSDYFEKSSDNLRKAFVALNKGFFNEAVE